MVTVAEYMKSPNPPLQLTVGLHAYPIFINVLGIATGFGWSDVFRQPPPQLNLTVSVAREEIKDFSKKERFNYASGC